MSPPDLHTDRLHLRQWAERDHVDALEIYGDPVVTRGLAGMQPVADLEGIRAFMANIAQRVSRYSPDQGGWAVALASSDRVIGGALLKPIPDADDQPSELIEIGWHLARRHWGQGFATEAARAVLAYGFETLGLDVIYALVMPENTPSLALARRLGMHPEGLTDAYYGQTTEAFTLKRSDWRRGSPG